MCGRIELSTPSQAYLGGETKAGKAILLDLVNATVGFEE